MIRSHLQRCDDTGLIWNWPLKCQVTVNWGDEWVVVMVERERRAYKQVVMFQVTKLDRVRTPDATLGGWCSQNCTRIVTNCLIFPDPFVSEKTVAKTNLNPHAVVYLLSWPLGQC
ncbi:hypothetical protein CEXT_538211 [Caerostris extrusa]|uniref:Uncharacterized protein n=1 Tax=Caerostris extrusa TaxID=172846 RepID=A0AAV4RD13_CAEEX|nr:hypothetical protein CEXT_538211 [Caerostris extrusa]